MKIEKIIHERRHKLFAVLIDPDKYDTRSLDLVMASANESHVDFIFVGGSLLTYDSLDETIQTIKSKTDIPVILFPGSIMQIHAKADALLLLSLISGRNPDLLIGNHYHICSSLAAFQGLFCRADTTSDDQGDRNTLFDCFYHRRWDG